METCRERDILGRTFDDNTCALVSEDHWRFDYKVSDGTMLHIMDVRATQTSLFRCDDGTVIEFYQSRLLPCQFREGYWLTLVIRILYALDVVRIRDV